ncbi:MAG: winged helix-turn-helix transcriptional regulator [Candidatus Bathyarchaeia archaeon]|jgi:DNA-binding Lrp family transcriptional regulator
MDKIELKLLSYLGQDPLQSNIAVARQLGVSRENVARTIERLKTERNLLGVSAQVSYSRLGLESVACLLRCQPDSWPLLETLCLEHPYTQYRIRCSGPQNGLFARFAIPPGTTALLLELFEKLVGLGKIESYDLHFPIAHVVMPETDYSRYTPGKGWMFDWKAWEQNWPSDPSPPIAPWPSILDRLDLTDMRILTEVSLDMLRTQRDIARHAGVSEPTLSRRLDFLRSERVIIGYRVRAGVFLTGLATIALFCCKCNFRVVKQVSAAVSELPFQCTVFPEQEGFVLYATLSSLDIPLVYSILKRHCSSVEMFWCDYLSSFRWALDSDPFQNGQWRTDHEYMVSNVMQGITPLLEKKVV